MKIGIYVHIPFCESRCIYCGFYSTTHNTLHHRYIDAVLHEIDLRCNEQQYADGVIGEMCQIDTVYIGGGTPSVLTAEELGRVLSKLRSSFSGTPREITVEMNPDDITPELIGALKSFGVNRISIGVQTFNDNRLKFLRRRHTAEQSKKAVKTIKAFGIENISIDLMFGFPGETMQEWQADIEQALQLSPAHISAYCLMYEEGTPLYKMLKAGSVEQIDDDTYLAMYTTLIDNLTKHGYEHYEISNFAHKGYRSIHNSSYWHDVPYLGFGASAHSYIGKCRSWNIDNLNEYIKSIESGVLPLTIERIDADTHYNDLVTTALRTREGLDFGYIAPNYREYALRNAERHIASGLLEFTDNHLRLTRNGLFVSDSLMSDLIKI